MHLKHSNKYLYLSHVGVSLLYYHCCAPHSPTCSKRRTKFMTSSLSHVRRLRHCRTTRFSSSWLFAWVTITYVWEGEDAGEVCQICQQLSMRFLGAREEDQARFMRGDAQGLQQQVAASIYQASVYIYLCIYTVADETTRLCFEHRWTRESCATEYSC